MKDYETSTQYEESIRREPTKAEIESINSNRERLGLPSFEEGKEGSIIPEPKGLPEALERIEKLWARKWFESLKRRFEKRVNKGADLGVIREEIESIESEINKAKEAVKLQVALSQSPVSSHRSQQSQKVTPQKQISDLSKFMVKVEYLRYENGFYEYSPEDHKELTEYRFSYLLNQASFGSHLSRAIGTYVYYLAWLKNKLPTQKIDCDEDGLITPDFKNTFNKVDSKEVYDHFKEGLVMKNLLSEETLLKYLKAAFEEQAPPKVKFQFTDIESRKKLIHVFYLFYKDKSGKPHGKKDIYVGLLCDYFEGFITSTVSSNFSKGGY